MKQKEPTKTFIMSLNWNNPLVSIFYTKYIPRCNGEVAAEWRGVDALVIDIICRQFKQ